MDLAGVKRHIWGRNYPTLPEANWLIAEVDRLRAENERLKETHAQEIVNLGTDKQFAYQAGITKGRESMREEAARACNFFPVSRGQKSILDIAKSTIRAIPTEAAPSAGEK